MWPTTDTTTAWWRSTPTDTGRASTPRCARGCDSPVAVLDLTAFEHNVADLRRRAGGVPIRVASKSIRVRTVISEILARDGFAGVLAYDVAGQSGWRPNPASPTCCSAIRRCVRTRAALPHRRRRGPLPGRLARRLHRSPRCGRRSGNRQAWATYGWRSTSTRRCG